MQLLITSLNEKNKIIILSKATVNKFKQTNFMSKNVSKEEFQKKVKKTLVASLNENRINIL